MLHLLRVLFRYIQQLLSWSRSNLKKLWGDVGKRKRSSHEFDSSPYVAELQYKDRDLDFRMPLTKAEAVVYNEAKQAYENIKNSVTDSRTHDHWLARKYLSLHDYFSREIERHAQKRKSDTIAAEKTIYFCEAQIEYAPVAVRAFADDPMTEALPAHLGYETLYTIRAEQGEYGEAKHIALTAWKQGWEGDWQAKAERMDQSMSMRQAYTNQGKKG
ncbi:hypothetical protein [Mechercharimyces sp. CAU 1602]|uniref:hypothetical protein n=1 Tax=Mechercharimyces sp. CAU 1602 TaxID=2973933 RepID=UPI00216148EB|nr:hypothetical protein [Mechercharimyces sp. CAU 1602]MCS1350692.1 hypothetical protein [Mechercharimyces sp. CAU 1602]